MIVPVTDEVHSIGPRRSSLDVNRPSPSGWRGTL
jgi:hypothetical protein